MKRKLSVVVVAATLVGLTVGAVVPVDAGRGGRSDRKIVEQLRDHEERIRCLEQTGAPCEVPSTTTTPPTTTAPPSPTTSTSTTSTSTTIPSSTTAPPTTTVPSGGCAYPDASPDGAWPSIGSQRLSSGDVLDGFVLNHDGSTQNHGIMPPNVNNTTVRNGIINSTSGDNIKLGDNSTYENLYLAMAGPGSGHLDALQGQGATGVTVRNVTIQMTSHQGVTGAILMQTMLGAGAGNRDINFNFDCVKLIGSGPFGHDIRIGTSAGRTVTGRITRTTLDGGVILATNRGGTCTFEIDATTLPYVDNRGCTIIAI